jgi:hypothetical protein
LKKVKEHVIIQNRLNNIKLQLTELFNVSNQTLKNSYQNRIDQLNTQSERLFDLWSEMEVKYAEQMAKGRLKNKEIIRGLIQERKRYKAQLNSIRIDLQVIMSYIQKRRLPSNLA